MENTITQIDQVILNLLAQMGRDRPSRSRATLIIAFAKHLSSVSGKVSPEEIAQFIDLGASLFRAGTKENR